MSNKLSRRKFLLGSAATVAAATVTSHSDRALANPFIFPFFGIRQRGNGQTSNGYTIGQSLRLNSANSTYLNRTPGTSTNTTTWTVSLWFKPASWTNRMVLFNSNMTGTINYTQLFVKSSSDANAYALEFRNIEGTSTVTTNAVFRDPSAWYHVVCSVDTTQATAANRVRIYVNGAQILSFAITSYPAQNATTYWNQNVEHRLGRENVNYGDLYISEVYNIDGYAYDPSYFGQTDTNSGQWIPRTYSGTYGTNGFYLKFADNSSAAALGTDSSGRGNAWTVSGINTYDQVLDSPTNNFCTWNPLDVYSTYTAGLGNGNLNKTSGGNSSYSIGTIMVSSGKWYWETAFTANGGLMAGIATSGPAASTAVAAKSLYYYSATGKTYPDATTGPLYGSTFAANDVVSIAFDGSTGAIWYAINGAWQASATSAEIAAGTTTHAAATGLSGYMWAPANAQSSGAGNTTWWVNFGQGGQAGLTYDSASGGRFKYAPPAGFKALCTANLPTPTLKSSGQYFGIALRTGTGAAYSVASLSFQPDLVWVKSRSSSIDHLWFDSVRGANKYLVCDDTIAEVSDATTLTSFSANGYSGGSNTTLNASGSSYVDWLWKKSAVAGFDIQAFTGNGTNQTVSHSLGTVPSLVIVKSRNADGAWPVYHGRANASPQGSYILFNPGPGFFVSDTTVWNNTAPTSSQFSVGASSLSNANGTTYVAYLWTDVAGFSKFGSYTGNNDTDGSFVYCGFKPKYLWLRATTNPGAVVDWWVYDSVRDTYNPAQHRISINGPAGTGIAEKTGTTYVDMLSNGFKIRTTHVSHNASGIIYIFAAFAEAPFKYATAR